MNSVIFISMAAWREVTLEETIKSAISNAKHPELIRFGIVFQGYEKDDWMIENIKGYPNVQIIKLDAHKSSPFLCNIRGDMALSMTSDEEYYLQIDAHSKFVKNWDIYLKKELELATEYYGKSFLNESSVGFANWEEPAQLITAITSTVDQEWFDSWPNEVIVGRNISKPKSDIQYQTLERFYCAPMVFGYLKDFYQCRQPRNISFELEQPFNNLRVYTAGYNLVSPSQSYIQTYDFEKDPNKRFHKYKRFEDDYQISRFFDAQSSSRARYKEVISKNIIDPIDGLYSERSLEDFIQFAGYDPLTKEVFRESRPNIDPKEMNPIVIKDLKESLGILDD